MTYLLETYGKEIIAAVVIAITIGILGWFAWKRLLGGQTTILRQNKGQKIKWLELFVIFLAVVQATNASFAVNEAESHMEFILRFVTHMAFALLSALLIHGLWTEIKEAIVASKVLLKFIEDWQVMTWRYGVTIIITFFVQWMQVVAMLFVGLLCIGVNLGIMGKVLGEEQLLYGVFIARDLSLIQGLSLMSDRLAINTIVSLLEISCVGLLGLLTFDTALQGAATKHSPSQVQWASIAGYLITHLFGGPGSSVKPNELKEVIEYIPSKKMMNHIDFEEMFVMVKDLDVISRDSSKSRNQRLQAGQQADEIRKEMRNTWERIAQEYTAASGKPTPQLV